jgi:glycosyltransferase involved in cell wall biosynthesis
VTLLFLEEAPRFAGGSERMSLTLCRHTVARGHRVLLAHAEDGDMVPAYAAAGASVHRIPARPVAIRRTASALRSVTSLSTLVRRKRVDLVFTSQVNYVSLLGAAKALTGVRTCVHLGLVYDYPSPLFRAGTRTVNVAVAPSTHTADGWRARGWPDASLRVIPNGVDTMTFSQGDGRSAARRRLGLRMEGDEPLIAYVGRLVEDKGILTLVRAFATWRGTADRGRLVFVGPGTPADIERLRMVARDVSLPDHAWEVRPATSTPEDVYRAADLVVVPSQWAEPFGLAPLEAMACGTLAVVSDCGILPEFVAPVGRDAVFTAGDPASLAERLTVWLGDATRRQAAADTLARHTRETYAFHRCGDAYLEAFREALAE